MRPEALYGLMAVSLGVVPACVPRTSPDAFGDHLRLDTAAIVTAAIAAFETPNGPIIEVVAQMRCRPDCAQGAGQAALESYARGIGADLVAADQPLPPCRWNSQVTEGTPKGLRLTVSAPVADTAVSIAVSAACASVRSGRREGFRQGATFQAEFVNGAWRITRTIEEVIT